MNYLNKRNDYWIRLSYDLNNYAELGSCYKLLINYGADKLLIWLKSYHISRTFLGISLPLIHGVRNTCLSIGFYHIHYQSYRSPLMKNKNTLTSLYLTWNAIGAIIVRTGLVKWSRVKMTRLVRIWIQIWKLKN